LQSLILINALSSACWEKKNKKRKENKEEEKAGVALFSPGPDMTCWLCYARFLWQLSAIKDNLRVSL
jgi:hypothetical protein